MNIERQFRAYLVESLKHNKQFTVLQIKFSMISEALRTPAVLKTILEKLNDALLLYGKVFPLRNGDFFLAYSPKIKDNAIRAFLIKIWMYFSADPQVKNNSDALTHFYTMPQEKNALIYEVSRIAQQPEHGDEERFDEPLAALKKKFVLPPQLQRPHKLLTPAMLARITKALTNTDFSNMIRRQPVCIILDDIQPDPLFEEVFVSIAELGESILPDVSLTATPWLFQDLTETLDKRVLRSVTRHDDGAFTQDFSLNLNVSTILSEDFRTFDQNIRASMKTSIVLELQPIDIFSDLNSYLMARDYAQNLGYKICVDGVTIQTLPFIDRERLCADYVKINWQQDLPYILESTPELKEKVLSIGTNRAILCRVDDENALHTGHKYEINLFQGRYIQYLMSQNPRNRRVGTTLLHRRY